MKNYKYLPKAYLRASGARLANFGGDDGVDFKHANLRGASLKSADLRMVDFTLADLEGANLSGADLTGARFYWTLLLSANLKEASIVKADLTGADLRGANLTDADLSYACLSHANLSRAVLDGCDVFGVSAWDVKMDGNTVQRNLRVSTLGRSSDSAITVDNLEVAQLIFLLLDNERIRQVIDTITSKVVLILGRFTPERKAVLDAIREQLRLKGYVPMLFDFAKPSQRDFDETVKVLAGLSRFVIADITNPSSSPLELQAMVPDYMIPFVPIIQSGEKPFSMFEGLQHKYWWVLDEIEYPSAEALLRELDREVIARALAMEQRIITKRARPRAD